MNIKSPEVERLVGEVVALTGETKTAAVRTALAERLARLAFRASAQDRAARLRRFLESEAWPAVPAGQIGKRLSQNEEERILGFDESVGDDPR